MTARGYLSDYFDGAAVKALSMVDATPSGSNQHEVGTTGAMREQFLGTNKKKFSVLYVWLDENEAAITEFGSATHYDARENQPKRSAEWRLYYQGNPVTSLMSEGDTLFLAKRKTKDELVFVVTRPDSTAENQMLWLFGLQRPHDSFQSLEFSQNESTELGFAGQLILEELGIEWREANTDELDHIVKPFNGEFPSTRIFSNLARETAPKCSPIEDPDNALVNWLQHEEALFRRLEYKALVSRLETGFITDNKADVDGFLSYSLSIQNRRKSRMGSSFEHHLAAVLSIWNIKHVRGPRTEGSHKPDFLFPDSETYETSNIGDPRLTMLGAKSTCKDRWRQILTEAEKIPHKHLATLEPGISQSQTDQMLTANIQLVVPKPIHESYLPSQLKGIQSIVDFLESVRHKQKN